MILAALVWGSPQWLLPAAAYILAAAAAAVGSYRRSPIARSARVAAAALKVAAVTAIALCLVEPLWSGIRPRPGANRFLILADNSQSLRVRDPGAAEPRSEMVRGLLADSAPWQRRLAQDFDVRKYAFDSRLRPVSRFSQLAFDGESSALAGALAALAPRWRTRPCAGLLLVTDGNATDWEISPIDYAALPPVYPVVVGAERAARDISVRRVSVSQTNFEAAPVTVLAEVACRGFSGQPVVVQLLGESGAEVQRQRYDVVSGDRPLAHRFQLRPEKPGIVYYQVRAFPAGEESAFQDPSASSEATLLNNTRWFAVDRGQGPYRVLYVTGRPNWDFKFLRRALAEEDEIQLVALVRVARREPKFTFRGHRDETTNPLYRGFGNQGDEQVEQYDQPVLLRLGTEDAEELRDGFPKSADSLFRYHAVIVDDVEAGFFTQDQMSLIQRFVSQRGGGFLMLGGRESFAGSRFEHTPIGEMLPVYPARLDTLAEEGYRWVLSRDGWLQPWVRLRATESEEQRRLDEMPAFRVLSGTRGVKPGATVLAQVRSRDGQPVPGLVVQRFGRGRSAALLVGDLWRWNLHRPAAGSASDLEKSWRQTVRWLVADVPGRIEVEVRRLTGEQAPLVELAIGVRDASFRPLDNASVRVQVKAPDGRETQLTAQSSDKQAGIYLAAFAPRIPGPYRAHVAATAADGSSAGECAAGWCADPAVEEFQTLEPNRAALQRLAEKTGGQVLSAGDLAAFARGLPAGKVPVTEPWVYPLWHQWPVLLLAIACLVGEWGIRRWKGLP